MPTSQLIYDIDAPKIYLTKAEVEKAKAFIRAFKSVKHNSIFAMNNRKVNPKKFYKDHFMGKLAEIAASKYLYSTFGIQLNPDFSIRKTIKEKLEMGYDSDLQDSNYNIHVKSYRHGSNWRESYCFQIWDNVIKNPKPNDYLIAVVQHDDHFRIRAFLPINKCKFKNPIKEDFIGDKKCVYAYDLLSMIE